MVAKLYFERLMKIMTSFQYLNPRKTWQVLGCISLMSPELQPSSH
jgi:hypothetical protein